MKFILALFLCASVAYANASPTCSESEIDECSKYAEREDESDKYSIFDDEELWTQEQLNYLCRYAGCLKDYKVRCGVESVNAYYQSLLIHAKKVDRLLCNTDSDKLRRKFLGNYMCTIIAKRNSYEECRVKETFDFKDPKYCPLIADSLDCENDFVGRECGKDARELNEALNPGLEFHGCKE